MLKDFDDTLGMKDSTNNHQKILVTVVIPAFNAEEYLPDCIRSIAQQKAFFEAIIIDDGSTDNTATILDEYAERDPRFKIIHTTNGGPASARNIGIKHATGKWITFVDADDLIEPSFLSVPDNYADADIIYTSYSHMNGNGEISESRILQKPEIIEDADEIAKLSCQCFDIYSRVPYRKLGSTWGKFFNADLIKEHAIKFPIGLSFYEDACFNWQCYRYAKTIVFANEKPCYIYRNNSTSLSRINDLKSLNRRFEALSYIEYNIYSPESDIAFTRFYIDQFFFALVTISKVATNVKDLFKMVSDLYKWPSTRRLFEKSIRHQGLTPLKKQFQIIKSRMSYILALKMWLTAKRVKAI